METSPPVRDVSERNREKRNKCIIVAVISILVLAGIILGAAYVTHFRFTELVPSAANSLVDAALNKIPDESVSFCTNYELVLKNNDTLLIERLGNCTARTQVTTLDEDDKKSSNETQVDEQRPNIVCKISAANVKITSSANATRQITGDCQFPVNIDVEFIFDGICLQNITFTPEASIAKSKVASGIAEQVSRVLAIELRQLALAFSKSSEIDIRIEPDMDQSYCKDAPWNC